MENKTKYDGFISAITGFRWPYLREQEIIGKTTALPAIWTAHRLHDMWNVGQTDGKER